MTVDLAHWQARLDELREKHHIPGATLAILKDGEVYAAASGVVNVETGIESTTDSIFQIGSISKVYTALLIMQLVDEGKVSLEEPVITYLPEFKVGDPELTRTVTVRHLLNHTSGIDGDLFLDLGRGDDVLAKYVAELADVPAIAPLGALMSYCNSGFVLAGRIVEVLREMSWDRALATHISEPFGLTHTSTLPEEAIRYRVAYGHATDPDTFEQTLMPHWQITRSMGPAGLINSTATDVVRFAEKFLGGLYPQMQEPQIPIPEPDTLGSHWGVGWILFHHWLKHDGTSGRVYGHDGNTVGQSAFLRIAPDANLAVCLMVNGGASRSLYLDLYGEIFDELAGITVPRPPQPVERAVDVASILGVYERTGVRMTVSEDEGVLRFTVEATGEPAVASPPQTVQMFPTARDGQFVIVMPGSSDPTPMSFIDLGGRRYVHFGVRATPKVS